MMVVPAPAPLLDEPRMCWGKASQLSSQQEAEQKVGGWGEGLEEEDTQLLLCHETQAAHASLEKYQQKDCRLFSLLI